MPDASALRADAAELRATARRIRDLASPLPDLIGTAAGRTHPSPPPAAEVVTEAVRAALDYAENLTLRAGELDRAADDAERSEETHPAPS